MTDNLILSQLNLLPEHLKIEVLHYISFLAQHPLRQIEVRKKTPNFGSAKGKYEMSADFNAPLEDFQEYM